MKVKKLIRGLRTLADELEAGLEQSGASSEAAAPPSASADVAVPVVSAVPAVAPSAPREMLTIGPDGSAKWEPLGAA
ncbi:MAG: hypothetical protein RB191_24905 [Terriglobia bacterium]|nr:hypothetical protein [Terriglobia bacterium]